jgi:hypothetical protein
MPKLSTTKQVSSLTLALLISLVGAAQNAIQDFTINLPAAKITNSLYKTVRLVDVRTDPQNLGIVQLGAFNRKARVVTEVPLSEQLSKVMAALTDSTAQEGELFLLLRQLSFAEVTGAMSERGYCHFRAVLFAKKEDSFQKLDAIDTVVVIKAMDVTKATLRAGSALLTGMLAANLAKEADGSATFSSTDVIHFDAVEKKSMPLYNTATYKDGLYKTFDEFKRLQPGETSFETEFGKDSSLTAVKTQNEKGKWSKVSKKELYAVVFNGQPYIVTEFGFYPLRKKEDDFYFSGKAKVAANSSDVMMASLFFGVIGGLIASSPGTAAFEMKLDHLSGGFERLKEVSATQQADAE